MSRVLVTGALGTVGAPLCQELRDRGHTVFECDVRHSGRQDYMRCNIADYRQLLATIEWARPDVVYNLAAEFGRRNGEEYYEQVWLSNVVGFKHLLTLQPGSRFRLIHMSSSEIYGECDADLLREHMTESQPIFPRNDYALSKWVNELQARNHLALHPDAKIVLIRFFNAYGPGEMFTPYRSVVSLFSHYALQGMELPVFENYFRVFMFIRDAVQTLANVADRFPPGGGVFNVGGVEYVSVLEVARRVLRAAGGSERQIRLIPEDVHNVRSKRPDISRAVSMLGHNPSTPLAEGIPATVRWMASVVQRER